MIAFFLLMQDSSILSFYAGVIYLFRQINGKYEVRTLTRKPDAHARSDLTSDRASLWLKMLQIPPSHLAVASNTRNKQVLSIDKYYNFHSHHKHRNYHRFHNLFILSQDIGHKHCFTSLRFFFNLHRSSLKNERTFKTSDQTKTIFLTHRSWWNCKLHYEIKNYRIVVTSCAFGSALKQSLQCAPVGSKRACLELKLQNYLPLQSLFVFLWTFSVGDSVWKKNVF